MDASPAVLARPYQSLKPPFLDGCENTGRPAITSPIYFDEDSIIGISSVFFSSLIVLDLNISKKSHSLSFRYI